MGLYFGYFIYSGFTMAFFKRMLIMKLTMKDIESIDPEYYNSLVSVHYALPRILDSFLTDVMPNDNLSAI